MSQKIKGVVEKINFQVSPSGSARSWKKKSLLVNGQWFGAFITKDNQGTLDAVTEGSMVQVEFETKGNFSNVIDVMVLSKAAVAEESPATKTYADSMINKDLRITYNGSLKSAVEFVKAAGTLGILVLPTKKADQLDALYEYVKHYTNAFVRDTYSATLEEDAESIEQQTSNTNLGEE